MNPRLRVLATALLLTTTLGVGACTVSTKDSSSGKSTPSSKSTKAGKTTSGDSSAAGLGDPVATRTSSADHFDLTLKVYAVKNSGGLAVANYTLTAKAADDDASSSGFQVAETFADGDTSSSDAQGDTTDGVKLLDSTNKQLHLVASDGAGNCLCSRNGSGTFVREGSTITLNSTYAALPAGVDKVDMVFPLFGTITGVPVD